MNGQRAFELLKRMTEEERQAVCIVWFDDEQLQNLEGDDYEKKQEFFDALPSEEKGELLEFPLYTPAGDLYKGFDDFLDYYAQAFETAIAFKMEKEKGKDL